MEKESHRTNSEKTRKELQEKDNEEWEVRIDTVLLVTSELVCTFLEDWIKNFYQNPIHIIFCFRETLGNDTENYVNRTLLVLVWNLSKLSKIPIFSSGNICTRSWLLLHHGIFVNGRMSNKLQSHPEELSQVLGTWLRLTTCFSGYAVQIIPQQNQVTMS